MKSSVFRSAPARVLILSLFASSLTGYVAMVSCSRTVAPAQGPAQQPAPPAAQPETPPAANAAPSPAKEPAGALNNPEPGNRFYGGTTKSAVITPPPAKNRAADPGTFYAPATKSDIVFRPQREAAPAQQPTQQVQQAPVQRVQ
jgi:hypothetical protein